jgi:hypothetical protein
MTGDIHYGGRVTDEKDRIVLSALTQRWISDRILTATASLKPDVIVDDTLESFAYAIPDFGEIAQYRAYVEALPAEDSPELLGLHPNIAIASRMRASTDMLNTLSKCQAVCVVTFLVVAVVFGGWGCEHVPSFVALAIPRRARLSLAVVAQRNQLCVTASTRFCVSCHNCCPLTTTRRWQVRLGPSASLWCFSSAKK